MSGFILKNDLLAQVQKALICPFGGTRNKVIIIDWMFINVNTDVSLLSPGKLNQGFYSEVSPSLIAILVSSATVFAFNLLFVCRM